MTTQLHGLPNCPSVIYRLTFGAALEAESLHKLTIALKVITRDSKEASPISKDRTLGS